MLQALYVPSIDEIKADFEKLLKRGSGFATQYLLDSYKDKESESVLARLCDIYKSKFPTKYNYRAYNGKLKFGILRQGKDENEMKQVLAIHLVRGYSKEHLNAIKIIIWALKEELTQRAGISR